MNAAELEHFKGFISANVALCSSDPTALLNFVNSYLTMLANSAEGKAKLKGALIASLCILKEVPSVRDHDGLLRLYEKMMELSTSRSRLDFFKHLETEGQFVRNLNFYVYYATEYAKKRDRKGFLEVYKKASEHCTQADMEDHFRSLAAEHNLQIPALDADSERTGTLFQKKARRRSSLAALCNRPPVAYTAPVSGAAKQRIMSRDVLLGGTSLEEYRAAKYEDEQMNAIGGADDMDISIVDEVTAQVKRSPDAERIALAERQPTQQEIVKRGPTYNLCLDENKPVERSAPVAVIAHPLSLNCNGHQNCRAGAAELTVPHHRQLQSPNLEIIKEIRSCGAREEDSVCLDENKVQPMTKPPMPPIRRPMLSERPIVSPSSPAATVEKRGRIQSPTVKTSIATMAASPNSTFTSNFYHEAKNVFSTTVNLNPTAVNETYAPDVSTIAPIVPPPADDFEIFCDAEESLHPAKNALIEQKTDVENPPFAAPKKETVFTKPTAVVPFGERRAEVAPEPKEPTPPNRPRMAEAFTEVRDTVVAGHEESKFLFGEDEATVCGMWKTSAGAGIVTSTPAVKQNHITDAEFFDVREELDGAASTGEEEVEEEESFEDPFKLAGPPGSTAFGRRMTIQPGGFTGRKSLGGGLALGGVLGLGKTGSLGGPAAPSNVSVSTALNKLNIDGSPAEKMDKPEIEAAVVEVKKPVPVVEKQEEKFEDALPALDAMEPEDDEVDLNATGVGLPEQQVLSSVNPWSPELRERIMKGYKSPHIHYLPGNCKRLTAMNSVTLGGETFYISSLLGQGGFAKVFKAKNSKNESLALKYEIPSCAWEGYICETLQRRLGSQQKMAQFMKVDDVYVYDNASVITNEYLRHGNLLELANNLSDPNWQLVIVLAIQLARILRDVHSVGIVHADVKPDNFMVLGKLPDTSDVEEVLACQTLRLIDWGRAIDMKSIGSGVTFTGRAGTESFDCPEMLEGRPWTYQTDYYGFLGTLHVLFFRTYMTVAKSASGRYVMGATFKRRNLARVVLLSVIDELLNIKSCEDLPSWDSIINRMQEMLRSNFDVHSWREAVRVFNTKIVENQA